MLRKIFFSIIIAVSTLIILEMGLRLFVKPSPNSYGTLFGKELPPLNLIPADIITEWKSRKDFNNKLADSVVVNGRKLTYSDLNGLFREDRLLGYTSQENSASTNGWRHYNNFGARSNNPISQIKPLNTTRILFFGDSYTSGSRVPDNETFIFYMSQKKRNFEFVNFGVDGYSMGQSFLRFETVKGKLQFDRVFLVFVPSHDLWRDININRYISFAWPGYYCYNLPIFVMENGKLKFIPAPYNTLSSFFSDNQDHVKARYKDYLRRYDYYYDSLYDSDYFFNNIILFKLIKKFFHRLQHIYRDKIEQPNNILMDTHFRALIVTKGIVEAMAKEVRSSGADFSLIVLPTADDISQYQTSDSFRKSWDDMTSYICSGVTECYDLMKDFSDYDVKKLDTGYDGSHNGPKTNALIADYILKEAF